MGKNSGFFSIKYDGDDRYLFFPLHTTWTNVLETMEKKQNDNGKTVFGGFYSIKYNGDDRYLFFKPSYNLNFVNWWCVRQDEVLSGLFGVCIGTTKQKVQ